MNAPDRILLSNDTAPFREADFQWISDWGFDFVRLPMSPTMTGRVTSSTASCSND